MHREIMWLARHLLEALGGAEAPGSHWIFCRKAGERPLDLVDGAAQGTPQSSIPLAWSAACGASHRPARSRSTIDGISMRSGWPWIPADSIQSIVTPQSSAQTKVAGGKLRVRGTVASRTSFPHASASGGMNYNQA